MLRSGLYKESVSSPAVVWIGSEKLRTGLRRSILINSARRELADFSGRLGLSMIPSDLYLERSSF